MPNQLITDLIELNQHKSAEFLDPGKAAERRRYRAQHPTRIIVLKCMDGRVNMALLTCTPVGIMYPFRNIGGIFDLGWPAFELRITDLVDTSIRSGVRNLCIATYHYSAGSTHRGCRGFNYDKDLAVRSTQTLVDQLNFVFGAGHEQLYPIMIGIETDSESLILHGRAGQVVTLVQLKQSQPDDLEALIHELYPDMTPELVADFLPLLRGNLAHQTNLATIARTPVELEHREQVIAVGQGFDWLHQTNYALIINDVDPLLSDSIEKAASIIVDNMSAERISNSGAVFFVSVSYLQTGHHRTGAIARALYLHHLGMEAIKHSQPKLYQRTYSLTAVMAWDTRLLETIEPQEDSALL